MTLKTDAEQLRRIVENLRVNYDWIPGVVRVLDRLEELEREHKTGGRHHEDDD